MNALKGAVITVTSSLFVAVLFAYLFRVPIPMGGMMGPLGEISSYSIGVVDVLKSVFVAWVFYGVFGGFIILPIFGAITGVVVGRKYAGSSKANRMIVWWSFIASAIPVFLLSTLDYIIGPW